MDDYRVATSPVPSFPRKRESRGRERRCDARERLMPARLGRVDIRLKRTIIALSPPILTVIPAKAGIQRVAGNVIVTRPLTFASANVNAP